MRKYSRQLRNGLIGLAVLAAAGWLVPSFFSAERYRRRLEAGLERALKRPVSFEAVSFRLLPRPGFSIKNAVVREDPEFGFEPLARVEQIDCDLRWRSLWRSRLDFARLRLKRPSFNLVRNARGEWNVGTLLRKSGLGSPAAPPARAADSPGDLELEVDGGRIDFQEGANKKPFAITGLRASLNFDLGQGRLTYRLEGSPIRTDLSLPTPGRLELHGEWTPGSDLGGPLDATLETRAALLYDWVPLLAGRNPEIYGLLDAEFRLTGTLRVLKITGESRFTQLRRWEQLPPADPLPTTLYFRGQFDRAQGRVQIESLDAQFADSQIHLAGSVDKFPSSPRLDLVVAVERSRLEDFLSLARRFAGSSAAWGVSGRVDGLLTVQGPWTERRYSGFLSVRDARLSTPSRAFRVSEISLQIDNQAARLAPFRLMLAPRVELVGEGGIYRAAQNLSGHLSQPRRPGYELVLSARGVPLHELVEFGRAMGVEAVEDLDAYGMTSGVLRLSGPAWLPARPAVVCRAELRAARLLLPGLTEALQIPHARIQVSDDQVVADPVVAVIGTSVFTGRLQHRGQRRQPWKFDARAESLSLEQGSLWFDVLGHRPPLSLLERIPGLRPLVARRFAATTLFSGLNAQGRFTASTVTYRALSLRDFRASVDISGRVVRVAHATFRAGGGRGQGSAAVDLTSSPARMVVDVSLRDAALQALAPRMPAALRKAHGEYSASGHFETRGLSREEMSANLQGQATVNVQNLFFGDFDPLEVLARRAGWGKLEAARTEPSIRSAIVAFRVRDRRLVLNSSRVELAGASLILTGTYGFDGTAELDVLSDFRRLTRRWLDRESEADPAGRQADLHLSGSLDKLVTTPGVQVSRLSQ